MNPLPRELNYSDKNYSINGLIEYLRDGKIELEESEILSTIQFLEEWNDQKEFIEVSTSGSTGTPKKIKLLKTEMVSSARLTVDYFDLDHSMNVLLCLPVQFIAGKMMFVRAMVAGWNLIQLQPTSNPLSKQQRHIDFTAMTPMQVNMILENSPQKFKLVDQMIIGGGAVSESLKRSLDSIKTESFSTYGMTETITHVAIKKLNGISASDHFEALNGVQFEEYNDRLIIHAKHLSKSPFITNDMVKIIDKHHFNWLGRYDNIINSGGIKINAEQLEVKLAPHLKKDFVILGLPDPILGEKVVLVVKGKKNDADNLTDHLSDCLDKYEIPKNIYFLEDFPLTPTGKINRPQLQEIVKADPH